MHTPIKRFVPFIVLVAYSFALLSAKAAIIQWDGGGTTNSWGAPANWAGDKIPSFPNIASIAGANVELNQNAWVAGFANSPGGVLTIGLGADLRVGTDGISNAGRIDVFGGSLIAYEGDVVLFGGGSIQLNVGGVGVNGTGDTLINLDNTIRGGGSVNMIDNRSLILADNPSRPLRFIGSRLFASNSGILRADGGTLQLADFITQSSTGRIEAINGSVVELLVGFYATGGTFATNTNGLIRIQSTGTFKSATLAGRLQLQSNNNYASADIRETFVNHGVIEIEASIMGEASLLSDDGIATLSGGGTIHLVSSGNATAIMRGQLAGDQLINLDNTIHGSGALMTGFENRGLVVADDPNARLTIQNIANSGVIRANGGALRAAGTINQSGAGTIEAINNSVIELDGVAITQGTVRAKTGGTVSVISNVMSNSSVTGTIEIDNSALEVNAPLVAKDISLAGAAKLTLTSTLSVSGDFTFDGTDPALWTISPSSKFELKGGIGALIGQWQDWQSLEIGSEDVGINPGTHTGSPAGFVGNFSLSALHIGPGAHVFLADSFDNSPGAPDALYVDSIVFDDPAGVLNLNGLNLYYHSISGAASQIIDSAVSIPEPGSAAFVIVSGVLFLMPRRRKLISEDDRSLGT